MSEKSGITVKASDKLTEVIFKGIGTKYHAFYPVTIVDNKETTGKAVLKDMTLEDDSGSNAATRLDDRLKHRETRRQKNIDNISRISVEQFAKEDIVTVESVSEDWIIRFFNIAEDISDNGMQELWGRILAAEVVQPGTFSYRTLEILKNLSPREAGIFMKFAALALQTGNTTFVANPDNSDFLLKEYQISFSDRLLLEEAGLINSNDLFYTLRGHNVTTAFEFGRIVLLVDRGNNVPEQSLPVLAFTKAGSELRKLIKQPLDLKYFNKLAVLFRHENVQVSYAYVILKKGTNITHSNPPVILPAE